MSVSGFVESLSHHRSNDELAAQQYRSLRPQVPVMYLAVFINVTFLASIAARSLSFQDFAMPLGLAVMIAVRLAQLRLPGSRHPPPSLAQMRRSMTMTVVAAGVISLGLSWWSGQILVTGDASAKFYIALFTALCTISCAACLATLPLAAYLVVAIGTFPVSLSLLMTGNAVLQAMAANLLLISPLMIGVIYRNHQQLRLMVASRSEIAVEKAKVSELAYLDPLTRLANRRSFLDALKDASTSSQSATIAIGIIDLDGFKLVNDTYGHQTGDALLVETALRFGRLSIGDTMIARLGGDEFAVLLRDVGCIAEAQARMECLVKVFEEPFIVDGKAFRMAASTGLAHSAAGAGTTLELINRADLAMYESKRLRGRTLCVFRPEMEALIRRRVMIEQALASEAESSLIHLNYQPIIETQSNRIVAFEALARWHHPTLGVIPPSEFIPLAEQAGRTEPTTNHLLVMALRAASTWPADMGLSFNLSAAELGSPTVAGRVLDLVAAENFDPTRLSIEVTETALLGDFTAARLALGTLQRGGVRILLDDFGAGYASIGYLREIQFDGIKLDGSLIGSILDNATAHNLLIGVLHLCQAIGVPVTAEMVENEVQYALLRSLGVDKLQGYHLGKPLTPQQALDACAANDDRRTVTSDSTLVHSKRRPWSKGNQHAPGINADALTLEASSGFAPRPSSAGHGHGTPTPSPGGTTNILDLTRRLGLP